MNKVMNKIRAFAFTLAALCAISHGADLIAIQIAVLPTESEEFAKLLESEAFRVKHNFTSSKLLCVYHDDKGVWYSYLSSMSGNESQFKRKFEDTNFWNQWSSVEGASSVSISSSPVIGNAPNFSLEYEPKSLCSGGIDDNAIASRETTKEYAFSMKVKSPPEFSEEEWSSYLTSCANSSDKSIAGLENSSMMAGITAEPESFKQTRKAYFEKKVYLSRR